MKGTLSRFAPYAAIAAALVATTAHAAPVLFQFSGTVRESIVFDEFGQATYDYSLAGQSVQASMLVETDGLSLFRYTRPEASYLSLQDQRDAVEWITSSLSIGSMFYDIGIYGADGGGLNVIDSSGPIPCGPGCTTRTPDQFSVLDFSTDSPDAAYVDGVFGSRTLQLGWSDSQDPFNPRDWITLTPDFGVSETLELPIGPDFYSFFNESWETCADFVCSMTSSRNTVFDITSVTRSVLTVPEAGTLGSSALAFAALMVLFAFRRGVSAAHG